VPGTTPRQRRIRHHQLDRRPHGEAVIAAQQRFFAQPARQGDGDPDAKRQDDGQVQAGARPKQGGERGDSGQRDDEPSP
jgi:hypothetical protein